MKFTSEVPIENGYYWIIDNEDWSKVPTIVERFAESFYYLGNELPYNPEKDFIYSKFSPKMDIPEIEKEI